MYSRMEIIFVILYYFGIFGLIIALGIFLSKALAKLARKLDKKEGSKKK